MTGSFNVGKIWFAGEAMSRGSQLIVAQLLRQFSPIGSGKEWKEKARAFLLRLACWALAKTLTAIEASQIDGYQCPLERY